MKSKIITIVIFAIACSFLWIFKNEIVKEYFITFKKDGVIYVSSNKHQLHEKITYKSGVIYSIESYKDSVKEGLTRLYYPNGELMKKCYYHLGQANGPEYDYYPNGKLKFTLNARESKRIGNFYEYFQNGKLSNYSAYDINGKPFCTFKFDSVGRLIKISPPISLATYSIDTTNNKVVALSFEEKHANIKDLYTTVGIPPDMRLDIKVIRNGIDYSKFKLTDNILKIEDAFPKKGLNQILVKINLAAGSKKVIENLTCDLSIIRE